MSRRLAPDLDGARLGRVASVRVLYADTDRMGVVYHATYLRFLEHARVELMRDAGLVYSRVEASGHVFPVTDLVVSYTGSARYDDLISVDAGVMFLSPTRIHFGYRLTVQPGDRHELDEAVEVLVAQTHHCCLRVPEGRPTRFPEPVYEVLRSCYTPKDS